MTHFFSVEAANTSRSSRQVDRSELACWLCSSHLAISIYQGPRDPSSDGRFELGV